MSTNSYQTISKPNRADYFNGAFCVFFHSDVPLLYIYRTFIDKSYVILSIRYIPWNSIGKSYEFHGKTMKSIGFTYRIPKYITDRQNYIGFTYRSPITYLYLFTVLFKKSICCVSNKLATNQIM